MKRLKLYYIDDKYIDYLRKYIVNINNMIPCPIEVLTEVLPTVKDKKYKILLENQISEINADRESLFRKIDRFYKQYKNELLPLKVINRCLNFPLLEKKCNDYNKN